MTGRAIPTGWKHAGRATKINPYARSFDTILFQPSQGIILSFEASRQGFRPSSTLEVVPPM
jgi:hypothetical protein